MDVQPGDETGSHQSKMVCQDVDEGGKTVSITDSTVATYAFDDEPTLTSAKVINQHGDVNCEELVVINDVFVVSTNGVSNTAGYTVSGRR